MSETPKVGNPEREPEPFRQWAPADRTGYSRGGSRDGFSGERGNVSIAGRAAGAVADVDRFHGSTWIDGRFGYQELHLIDGHDPTAALGRFPRRGCGQPFLLATTKTDARCESPQPSDCRRPRTELRRANVV
jgi:hypothetical protein